MSRRLRIWFSRRYVNRARRERVDELYAIHNRRGIELAGRLLPCRTCYRVENSSTVVAVFLPPCT